MDQFDELLHQRAAEESFPLPEDYAGRLWTKIPDGVSDATGKHGSQQRLRCSSQFQTYPPQLRQRWRRSLGWGRW